MKENDPVLRELGAIKRLMVLFLLRQGFTQAQIGAALEIDRTGIGRMFPAGVVAGLSKKGDFNE